MSSQLLASNCYVLIETGMELVLLLYIKDIFFHNIIFLGNCTFECIIVSILIGSCKFCICLLFRPPNSSVDVLDNLYSVLCNCFLVLSFYSNW